MFIPIIYTKYGNSKLATFISFVSSVILAGGIAIGFAAFADGEKAAIAMTIVCAVIWYALKKLAAFISNSKTRRTS